MNVIKSFLFGGPGGATPLADFGLFLARASFGLMMAVGHGYAKVWDGNELGPGRQMIDGVASLGFPAPAAFAWAAALTEFVGAGLMAAGLLTRPAALVLAINMGVAAFLAHGNDPWFATGKGGAKEMALLYLIPAVMFVFAGGGRFSIDALLRRKGKGSSSRKPAAE